MMRLALLFGLMAGTCAWLLEPVPPGEVWRAPAHYREIWDSAEACTGKRGDYDRVTWYRMPGNSFPTSNGAAIGLWNHPHSITLAMDWVTTDWVVKHEMIHDLTGLPHDGTGSEPGPRDTLVWGTRCHAMWGFQPKDSSYVP